MRFFKLVTIILLFADCSNKNDRQNTELEDSVAQKNKQISYHQFNQSSYNFSVKKPTCWTSASNTIGNKQILNLFSKQENKQINLPLKVHEKSELSYVSFFPDGYGVELPAGKSLSLAEYTDGPELNIQFNPSDSQVFLLENDQVYAYYLVPSFPPVNWRDDGFIFAQVAIEDFSATCYDEEGNRLNMRECDPLMGDVLKKEGNIVMVDQQIVRNILSSITFQQRKSQNELSSDLIKVNKPGPEETVDSPIEIEGEARGQWYFEGDFPIQLLDAQGNTISESFASAQSNWMTENFVPFTASIDYSIDENQEGLLILIKANPSGRPQNADSVRIALNLSADNK